MIADILLLLLVLRENILSLLNIILVVGALLFLMLYFTLDFFFLSPYLSFSKYYSSVKTKCPSRYYSSHKTFIKFHFYYNYLCGYYGKPFPVYLIIVSSKFLHIVQVEWILVIQENNKII